MSIHAKTVTVFDDDNDLLDIFRFLFEEEQCTVHTFSDCNNILDKVKSTAPDLILMDNWIPDSGGEVAVKQLKADDELSHIPVIYVSANNDVREIAARAGAERFLAKPFDFDELLAMASELVGQS
jgi:two-component system cell cycle response regulator DivK